MYMKSHWIEHKGKRVLLADYSGLGDDAEAIYAEGQYVVQELKNNPGGAALVINDVHDTHASIANSNMMKKILAQSKGLVAKRAVIGLTSTTRYFVNALIHLTGKGSLIQFDSLEKALDWIVEE
jgi:hypothetical protein